MGMNFNNSVDADLTPNQASTSNSLNYQAEIPPGATPAGPQPIFRKGVITRLELTGGQFQTNPQVFRFASPPAPFPGALPIPNPPNASYWLPGDTVFISGLGEDVGGGTITIEDTTGAPLCTWAHGVAKGGMFVYGAGIITQGDFGAVIPGLSST